MRDDRAERELELWGGYECTVNRVGDAFGDQTQLSGHQDRIEDLDRFAELGLKTLRYPILWERTEIEPGRWDWRWSDERMARLQALGINPIVGLVHHGSGPAWTSLMDERFASGLAPHAEAVARRYPWVTDWTPVNEPLTTARFSALYGLWYPHLKDEGAFWTALLNQIDATRLAMRAIRRINPAARLVQTEDFGRTYATAPCAAQARFENARRLMTWDLLCGKVTPRHPLWRRLARYGLAQRLAAIAADPCPPDVIGMNYYVTSDRFLDHRLDRYPKAAPGGNGQVAYADVEAVRALNPTPVSWDRRLSAVWRRYRLPLAVTECHLGCTREEQLRWLNECWGAARRLRDRGADIRAVTVWSLLGAHGWDSLLTSPERKYESGVFDLSDGEVRPTALAWLVRDLATKGGSDLLMAQGAGWWRRPQRLFDAPPEPEPTAAGWGFVIRQAHPLAAELVEQCRVRGLRIADAAPPDDPGLWLDADLPEGARSVGLELDRLIDRSLAL